MCNIYTDNFSRSLLRVYVFHQQTPTTAGKIYQCMCVLKLNKAAHILRNMPGCGVVAIAYLLGPEENMAIKESRFLACNIEGLINGLNRFIQQSLDLIKVEFTTSYLHSQLQVNI